MGFSRLWHRLVEWFGLFLFLLASLWFYRGFFHPDPLFVDGVHQPNGPWLILACRIAVPVAVLLLLVVYFLIRKRVLPVLYVGLILLGLSLGALLLFAVGSHLYYRWTFARVTDDFHPYLQLSPPELKLRDAGTKGAVARVICLGGSTTAWGDSQGLGWTARLEERLQQRYRDKDIQVYNQGREWYTTLHSLLNYAANLRTAKPQVVVIMHGINDLMHNATFNYFSRGALRSDYGHYLGPITNLVRRKTLPAVAYSKFRDLWYAEPRQLVSASEFPALASFERNLRSLIQLIQADGARVVLMSEPYLFKEQMPAAEIAKLEMLATEAIGPDAQWDVQTALRGMQQYNAATQRVAQQEGVAFIDLERAVPKTLEYFVDDVHYADRAFPLVADAVAAGVGPLIAALAP